MSNLLRKIDKMNRPPFFIPVLLILFCSCKSNNVNRTEMKRMQDSLAVARFDSINLTPQLAEAEEIIRTTDSATNAMQIVYDAALTRFDSVVEEHIELDGMLNNGKSEISKVNIKLKDLFKNRKMSEAERSKAQMLIDELNREIDKLIKKVSSKK